MYAKTMEKCHGVVDGVTCTLHVRSGRTDEDKYVPTVWPAWSGQAVQCFFTNQDEPHKSEAKKGFGVTSVVMLVMMIAKRYVHFRDVR